MVGGLLIQGCFFAIRMRCQYVGLNGLWIDQNGTFRRVALLESQLVHLLRMGRCFRHYWSLLFHLTMGTCWSNSCCIDIFGFCRQSKGSEEGLR